MDSHEDSDVPIDVLTQPQIQELRTIFKNVVKKIENDPNSFASSTYTGAQFSQSSPSRNKKQILQRRKQARDALSSYYGKLFKVTNRPHRMTKRPLHSIKPEPIDEQVLDELHNQEIEMRKLVQANEILKKEIQDLKRGIQPASDQEEIIEPEQTGKNLSKEHIQTTESKDALMTPSKKTTKVLNARRSSHVRSQDVQLLFSSSEFNKQKKHEQDTSMTMEVDEAEREGEEEEEESKPSIKHTHEVMETDENQFIESNDTEGIHLMLNPSHQVSSIRVVSDEYVQRGLAVASSSQKYLKEAQLLNWLLKAPNNYDGLLVQIIEAEEMSQSQATELAQLESIVSRIPKEKPSNSSVPSSVAVDTASSSAAAAATGKSARTSASIPKPTRKFAYQ